MAGGQRIDDHKFWAGGKGKDSVFPDGPHKTKPEMPAESAGELAHYEDTTEAIRDMQMMNDKKAKSHQQKTGYRN
jgi:hypothetical protein